MSRRLNPDHSDIDARLERISRLYPPAAAAERAPDGSGRMLSAPFNSSDVVKAAEIARIVLDCDEPQAVVDNLAGKLDAGWIDSRGPGGSAAVELQRVVLATLATVDGLLPDQGSVHYRLAFMLTVRRRGLRPN